VPTLDVFLTAPTAAATQSAGPAGQLQLFAKLYDVAPDGSKTLVNKLISPVRVADVSKSVHIELPGIVHRVAAGHRLQLVLSSTDAAYKNADALQPVTVTANQLSPARLRIPVVG
jgi:predicted acyl esterase